MASSIAMRYRKPSYHIYRYGQKTECRHKGKRTDIEPVTSHAVEFSLTYLVRLAAPQQKRKNMILVKIGHPRTEGTN